MAATGVPQACQPQSAGLGWQPPNGDWLRPCHLGVRCYGVRFAFSC